MSRPIVVFCMPDSSHVRRLRSVITGLSADGTPVHVFTGRQFQADVEQAGGTFADLFAYGSIDDADAESMPMPARLVSFAGRYAGAIAGDVASLQPALVVHDTFAVVGTVVAGLLGVPRVNVCAGHNVNPSTFIEALATDPRVKVAPRCHEAVDLLRSRYGMADASPFAFVAGLSRDLNLYCEPPAFLDQAERHVFEPLAFYGSLPDSALALGRDAGRSPEGRTPTRIYICFGTIVWRYYRAEALRALAALASWFGRQPATRVVISLGGAAIGAGDRARIEQPNVSVHTIVDQWSELARSDVFITHHGLNSTHEAIVHRVPMISYPFFWDQPALADRCHALGLAVPLSDAPRGAFADRDIEAAWSRLHAQRGHMMAALETAREWELAVVADRPAVLARVRALARQPSRRP